MAVIDLIKGVSCTAFSFELLPPIKGDGMKNLFKSVDALMEFNPLYINITNHRSEPSYRELSDGLFECYNVRQRPSTVAVAAALHARYGITTVPHILCSGHSREETECLLFDLQYLGISDVLALRGDKAKEESFFKPVKNGWKHALELERQINEFNRGILVDGSSVRLPAQPIHYGIAGYPEKHEEAPNMEQDIFWLKKKVEAGAEYIVTQMFFDNYKYLKFVERARHAGITVPIIPGIKPLSKRSHLTTLPQTFNIDFPLELSREVARCKHDEEVRQLGIDWAVNQCKDLMAHHVPNIHFYSMGVTDSIRKIAGQIY